MKNIIFYIFTLFLIGCAPESFLYNSRDEAAKLSDNFPLPKTEEDKRLLSALIVMKTNCMNCHANWQNFNSNEAWVNAGYVVPGNLNESPLLSRTRFADLDGVTTDSSMPRIGSDLHSPWTEEKYMILREWITKMVLSESPDSLDQAKGLLLTSADLPRIADRRLMANIFLNIFGPNAQAIINELIIRNVTAFGGGCDARDPADCSDVDIKDEVATLVPSSSAVREGYRMRTCRALVSSNLTLSYAITKASGVGAQNRLPNSEDRLAAYNLFFPGFFPDAGALQALNDVVLVAASKFSTNAELEAWRYLMMTICYAPDWQMN